MLISDALRYTKGGGEAHSRDRSYGDDTVSGPRAEKDGRQKKIIRTCGKLAWFFQNIRLVTSNVKLVTWQTGKFKNVHPLVANW